MSPGVDRDQVWTTILEGAGAVSGMRPGGRAEREVRSEIQGRGEAGLGLGLLDFPRRASLGFTQLPPLLDAQVSEMPGRGQDWRKPCWRAMSSLSVRSLTSYLWPVSWLIKMGISSIRAQNDVCYGVSCIDGANKCQIAIYITTRLEAGLLHG